MHHRIAIFPGTFDPITLGHVDIVERILPFFDQLYISIGLNTTKQNMFSVEQRIKWMKTVFKHEHRIICTAFEGLTIHYCKQIKATTIIRGIRLISDFENEKVIADVNRTLDPSIETIFLTSLPKYSSYASTVVREIIRNNGKDISSFVPANITKEVIQVYTSMCK